MGREGRVGEPGGRHPATPRRSPCVRLSWGRVRRYVTTYDALKVAMKRYTVSHQRGHAPSHSMRSMPAMCVRPAPAQAPTPRALLSLHAAACCPTAPFAPRPLLCTRLSCGAGGHDWQRRLGVCCHAHRGPKLQSQRPRRRGGGGGGRLTARQQPRGGEGNWQRPPTGGGALVCAALVAGQRLPRAPADDPTPAPSPHLMAVALGFSWSSPPP